MTDPQLVYKFENISAVTRGFKRQTSLCIVPPLLFSPEAKKEARTSPPLDPRIGGLAEWGLEACDAATPSGASRGGLAKGGIDVGQAVAAASDPIWAPEG